MFWLREELGHHHINRHLMLLCTITDNIHHFGHLVKVLSVSLQFYHCKITIFTSVMNDYFEGII